jgi:hypothetical protein
MPQGLYWESLRTQLDRNSDPVLYCYITLHKHGKCMRTYRFEAPLPSSITPLHDLCQESYPSQILST